MRYFYSAMLGLLMPFIILRLLWKSMHFPVYRQRIKERFVLRTQRLASVDVWLHAVSLGEVIAAIPLIDALLNSNLRLMVTTTTPTGSKKLVDTFGLRIKHQFLPYDLLMLQRRFIKIIQPKKVIIMETELWPNMIHAIKSQNIPLILVNARLSQKSFQGYYKIRHFIAPYLRCFSYILTQTKADAVRFIELGAVKARVEVIGNLKFDAPLLQQKKIDAINKKRALLGANTFIWIAASTHANEEQLIIDCFLKLKASMPSLLLMIAPRHPERFTEVIKLAQQSAVSVGTRTHCEQWNDAMDIIVLDSLGELPSFYSISDLCFLGGSLVPIGGHNMIEPAQAGVPIICGHYFYNFSSVVEALKAEKAIEIVATPQQLITTVFALYRNKTQANNMVHAAKRVLERNQGALKKYIDYCLKR